MALVGQGMAMVKRETHTDMQPFTNNLQGQQCLQQRKGKKTDT